MFDLGSFIDIFFNLKNLNSLSDSNYLVAISQVNSKNSHLTTKLHKAGDTNNGLRGTIHMSRLN